ncbi:MAG: U32 family peptidase, partial [Eubacterium sp.]|nr:U32 family peptidase [Eubacterium sp.]
MKRKPEILAPAGSIDILYADLAMGADAVYIGAPKFSARAFADNPGIPELTKALTYAHMRGKKIYLTVNTLLHDDELENELIPMLDPLVDAGLDAVIVQDPGVIIRLHEKYPFLPLHASTQMALFSGDEAELLKKYGVTRFVPARELSIDEVRAAREQTDLEIEVFVHGALCVCYSGWCLMSEYIGGRSGNRGMCAGPCRLPYLRSDKTNDQGHDIYSKNSPKKAAHAAGTSDGRGLYELNTKDLETLLYIPELVNAGIDSFKIEGRMKSMEYASYNAWLYRHYTDVFFEEGEEYYIELAEDKNSKLHRDIRRSMDIYNRGGFFDSFLFTDKADTIEKKVKGHFGIEVGRVKSVKVLSKKNSTAVITLSEEIHPQDVLSIRDENGETVYEFTVGDGWTSERSGNKASKNSSKNTTLNTARYTDNEFVVNTGYSDVEPDFKVYRTKNANLIDQTDEMIKQKSSGDLIRLKGEWIGTTGKPACLNLSCDFSFDPVCRDHVQSSDDGAVKAHGSNEIDSGREIISIKVSGSVIEKARERAVTADDVRKRLEKLGGTGYVFDELDITMPEDGFIPLGSIKELKRKAISELEKKYNEKWKKNLYNCKDEDLSQSIEIQSLSDEVMIKKDISGNRSDGKRNKQEEIKNAISDCMWIRVLNIEQWRSAVRILTGNTGYRIVLQAMLEGFDDDEINEISGEKIPGVIKAFSLPRAFRGYDKERFLRSGLKSIFVDSGGAPTESVSDMGADKAFNFDIFVVNSMAS